MLVLVFVTDDGTEEGSGPLLYLSDAERSAVLPPNPRSLEWRYFATVALADQMFSRERDAVEAAMSRGAAYISQRLVK